MKEHDKHYNDHWNAAHHHHNNHHHGGEHHKHHHHHSKRDDSSLGEEKYENTAIWDEVYGQ